MDDSVGRRVKRLRQQNGLSQRALAAMAGLSDGAISLIENERRTRLYPGTAPALANALGVSVAYLLDGDGTPTPPEEKKAERSAPQPTANRVTAAIHHDPALTSKQKIKLLDVYNRMVLGDA